MNKATFDTTYVNVSGTFANNTTRLISEGDLRQFSDDLVDSALFIDDNFIDEDTFATDSATKAPSQQSTKAYIATQISANSNGVIAVVVEMTAAQVKASNSTPFTIVSAVADKVIFPFSISTFMDYNSQQYDTSNSNYYYVLDSTAITDENEGALRLLRQTADSFCLETIVLSGFSRSAASATWANKALKFKLLTGDSTNGDSKVRVRVVYTLVDVSAIP